MFTQNEEESVILRYFRHQAPASLNFLDIGANDGVTFSNIRQLALNGWSGACLEPSPKAYEKLVQNFRDYLDVKTYNFGISETSGEMEFHDSGNWVDCDYTPASILGTLHESNKERFFGMNWDVIKCNFVTFEEFIQEHGTRKFDFISIDVEGHDLVVLRQINLREVGCQLICLEHSENEEFITGFSEYCESFGMREINRNKENIFFSI